LFSVFNNTLDKIGRGLRELAILATVLKALARLAWVTCSFINYSFIRLVLVIGAVDSGYKYCPNGLKMLEIACP
jgi:hypothetical protein